MFQYRDMPQCARYGFCRLAIGHLQNLAQISFYGYQWRQCGMVNCTRIRRRLGNGGLGSLGCSQHRCSRLVASKQLQLGDALFFVLSYVFSLLLCLETA